MAFQIGSVEERSYFGAAERLPGEFTLGRTAVWVCRRSLAGGEPEGSGGPGREPGDESVADSKQAEEQVMNIDQAKRSILGNKFGTRHGLGRSRSGGRAAMVTAVMAACAAAFPSSALAAPVSGWVIDFNTASPATLNEPTPGTLVITPGATNSLNGVGVRANFTDLTLTNVGSSLTVAATMQMTLGAGGGGNIQYRFGAFNSNGSANTAGWLGYWQANPSGGNQSALYERNSPNTGNWNSLTGATLVGGTFTNPGAMPGGTYLIQFQYTRQANNALLVQSTMLQLLNQAGVAPVAPYNVTRSVLDTTVNTFTFNRVGYFFGGSMNANGVTTFSNVDATVRTPTFWNIDTGGDWGNAANWTAPVPNAGGAVASFGGGGVELAASSDINLGGVTRTVGTLELTNPTFSYTLTNGTLRLDDSLSRATLKVNSGTHTLAGNLETTTRGADLSVFEGGSTFNVNGTISGAGTLTKAGNGTLVASGNVSVPSIAVQSGELVIGNGVDASTLSSVVTVSGGTFLNLNQPGAFTLGNVLSGAGGLRSRAATLNVNAANSYAGPTQILSGNLIATTIANGGTNSSIGSSSNAAANLVFGGGALTYAGASTTSDRNFTIRPGQTASIDVVNAATVLELGGAAGVSDGSLVKQGPGTLVLNGALAYSGTTTSNGGKLIVNGVHTNAGAYTVLGSFGGAGTIANSVTLTSVTPATVEPGRGSGSAGTIGTLTTGTFSVVEAAYTLNYDLSASPVVGGVSNDLIVVNGDLTIANGTTIALNPLSGILGAGEYGLVRYTGSGNFDTNALTLTGLPTTTVRPFAYQLGTGSINGADNYLKLTVTSTPFDLLWNGGNGNTNWDQLATQNWQRTNPTDEVFVAGDRVTFDDSSANKTVDIVGSMSPGATVVSTQDTYNFQGAGSILSAGGLVKNGSGTLILSTAASFAGTVEINAGTLQIGNGGATGSLVAPTIVNNGTIVMNNVPGTPLASNISGTGGINVLVGDVAISGNSSFDGPVVVSGGRVFPTNANAFGSGNGSTTIQPAGQIYITAANLTFPEPLVLAGGVVRTGGTRTVIFEAPATLTANSTITNDAGSRLILNGVVSGDGDLAVGGGGATNFGGDVNLAAGRSVLNSGNVLISPANGSVTMTVSSPIGGTGNINFGGPGTAVMNAPMTATTAVNFGQTGTVNLNVSNALTGAININDGVTRVNADYAFGSTLSTIAFAGQAPTQANIALAGNITIQNPLFLNGRSGDSPYFINEGGTNTVLGNMQATTGGVNYNFRSDAGLLKVNGNYLQIGGGTDRFIRLFGDGNGEFNGNVAGTTGFTARLNVAKFGGGTWSLSGTLAYAGDTTVTGGALQIKTPLRPVTGSLVVAGPGVSASLEAPASASAYTIAGELAGITVGSAGQGGVSTARIAPTNRPTQKASVVITGALSIDESTGLVDVGNNDLIVRNGAGSLSTLRSYAATFITSSGVTGLGTTSASPFTRTAVFANAAQDGSAFFASYDGVALTATDVVVKYTYVGDTNLDGKLDGNDLANLIEGLSNGLTGWENGDVDYNGVVNAADYSAFAAAYAYYTNPGNAAPNLGDGQGGSGGGGVIPEPTSLGLLALGVPMLSRRRRSR